MARSEKFTDKNYTFIVGTNYTDSLDITNFSGGSIAMIGPSAGAGDLTIQYSNDGTNWRDTDGTDTIASGFGIANKHALHTGFIRAKVVLSDGAGQYFVKQLAKDF